MTKIGENLRRYPIYIYYISLIFAPIGLTSCSVFCVLHSSVIIHLTCRISLILRSQLICINTFFKTRSSQNKQGLMQICLLISSLPGKALRMLVEIARLAERFNMHSQSRAWRTWYQNTRTRYSFYQFTHCFTLQTSDYNVIFNFCVDSVS